MNKEETMKRLYRSRKNKVIAGVCGGVAEYFSVDPTLIRLAAVLIFFMGGASLIAYIIGWALMPVSYDGEEGVVNGEVVNVERSGTSNNGKNGTLIFGIILVSLGCLFLLDEISFFNPFYRWFWHHGWEIAVSLTFVGVGAGLLLKSARK